MYRSSPSNEAAFGDEHLRLTLILEQMPVGIGVFNDHGDLFHANSHFERIVGGPIATLDAFSGPGWRGYQVDGAPLADGDHPGRLALRGEVATPGAEFMRTDTEQSRWLGVSAVPLNAPGKSEPVGAVVVVESLDARKLADQRLLGSEARFQQFAEHSSSALWIVDAESGRFDFLSPAALRLAPDADAFRTLGEWDARIHPDDRAHVAARRVRIAAGEPQRLRYRIVDGEGATVRHLRETSFPIPPLASSGLGIGSILEDVSPDVLLYLVSAVGAPAEDLSTALRRTGHRLKTFAAPADLFAVADVLAAGCVFIDVRGAETRAAEMVRALRASMSLPVVLVGPTDAGPAEVVLAVRAGATDYIPAPASDECLAHAIAAARATLPANRASDAPSGVMQERLARLSRREREVLLGLVSGGTNKSIARGLQLSPRTIEVHRAHLMERLNVRTLSELIQVAVRCGLRADA